jgi:hypothetical protein
VKHKKENQIHKELLHIVFSCQTEHTYLALTMLMQIAIQRLPDYSSSHRRLKLTGYHSN